MDPDDRDQPDDRQPEHSYEETARSIFSALWFRVVLVLIVCGVIAAVAVPYVLEWMNPPPPKTAAVKPAPPEAKPPGPPATPPPPALPAAAKPAVTPAPAPPPAIAKEEKEAKAARPARRPARAAATRAPAGTGAYFVQVGAFKDPERARSLAAKLREQKFSVDESTVGAGGDGGGRPGAAAPAPAPSSAAGDKYDVFVTGSPAADLSARLTAKGLATEQSGGGVVVKPSLPLRDAVALSKDLAAEGLKVQVRRAGAPAPAPATPAAAASGETLHRVRVGPFADLAAARAARTELETKGYKGFIARGGG